MEQTHITKLHLLIHPFCYAIYEDTGEAFPSDPPFFDNGRFELYIEYERGLRTRWHDAISTMGPEDALVVLPIGSFKTQDDLERHARQCLGPRCIILPTNPFRPAEASPSNEQDFRMGVADDLLHAFQSRGYEWKLQDMKIAVDYRGQAWQVLAAFRDLGLCFDPATVDAEAWGESFDGCVTKWSNGLGTYLGLQKPVEKEFAMTIPDAPFLLTARFVERVHVSDVVRLFLFEETDSRPLGLFLKTGHHVWDRLLVVRLPADSAGMEVRRKTNERVWPAAESTLPIVDGAVEIPIYGGSYSDDPTYIFGEGIRMAEFRERLMALAIAEK